LEENGIEDVLFAQQLRIEKHMGNVDSALNGCARITLSR
jgi:hypothetical protein